MLKPSKHVVPSASGGWAVKNAGAVRASKTFDTQEQAVGYARIAAKKTGTELYIHGRDGTIKDKRSYGSDKRNRSGTANAASGKLSVVSRTVLALDARGKDKGEDIVKITETRPVSKTKDWVVTRLVEKAKLV